MVIFLIYKDIGDMIVCFVYLLNHKKVKLITDFHYKVFNSQYITFKFELKNIIDVIPSNLIIKLPICE